MVHDELEKYSEWVVTEYQKIRLDFPSYKCTKISKTFTN